MKTQRHPTRGIYSPYAPAPDANASQHLRGAASESRAILFWTALSLISFASVSCTNSFTAINNSNTGTTSTENNVINLVNITQVLFDNINPSTTLDVFGDGSGSMATYCTSSGGLEGGSTPSTSSTDGTSNCACNYTFVTSTGVSETIQADTTYHESNMIECLYTGIPEGVTNVTVSVDLITQDQNSNSVTFPLTSTTSTTSSTNIMNFNQVARYQCEDVVSIPYVFGPAINPPAANAIYDPILSSSSALAYPLDFYTTNMGGTYAQYVQADLPANNAYWNCPANPTVNSATVNMNLYSVAADDGSYQMYPYSGSGDNRSTFYVSNTANGVFTVPLNAYIAPTMISENVNPNAAPIGYGASPISTGTGTETCPDTVAIPPGYQWVKVWLFRADLVDRTFQVSTAIETANSVACSPGTWPSNPSGGANNYVFQDCGNNGGGVLGEEQPSGIQNLAAGSLADRVIAGEGSSSIGPVCVDMNTSRPPGVTATGASGCTQTGGEDTCQGPGATSQTATEQYDYPYTLFGSGTDLWLMREGVWQCGAGATSPLNTLPEAEDPLDLCGHKYGTDNVPNDRALSSVDLDAGNPRYDFVFVVSPESVESGLMETQDPSVYPWIPERWPNASDCMSPDPNNPETVGDCNPSKMISYGLQQQDVATSGAPTGETTAPVIFPMCAIQPIPSN